MWEATNLAEKKLNAETHKYIAEEKLHQFGEFIEEYTSTTSLNRIQTIARNDFVSNPIFTDEKATEGVSILHLTHSDNGTLSRILSTLGGMCQEIEYLKQEAEELYPSLLYYEEEVGGVRDSLESLSKIIEPLQRTLTLVKRIRDVIVLTLKQLSAILQKGYYVSNSSSSFPEILYLFADMLICLLKFDALLEDQVLRSHWMAYRRTKNQTQAKSYKDLQLDILSSLKVCEQVLKGPNTKWRLVVANLAISASGLNAISEIRSVLQQLEIFSKFTHFVNTFCDCSVLYWHFSYVMPVYFSKLVASKSNLSKCYPLLSTVTDCATMNGKDILGEASTILREKLCGPLNQIIETNLRLQTHLHLDLPPSEPFQNYFSVNFNKLLPIPLDNVYKSIKNDTEHYMSTTFYNLTTVVLHDWRTYGEMRRLALLQYNLETVDDDLPMQTLDQGLDVLEIMRNINVFVQKYLYNLNTQIFIEETSNNKHLNSINISHVANSIRSHGIGIMNTTVNYTYQFLKIKFRIFSQFLFDEQIKSRLLKDLRHFIDHKNECHQMYPYERADKFNKGIRKLGLSNEGDSYLDLFRKVITQIGNAMGYVRLIRSGGNRCLAQGTCFIPDLTKTESLVSDSDSKSMSEMTSNSAQLLLKDLKSFTENFENTTEYFKLLVQAFIPHFRNPNNMHLKNFFIIVPPLTVNFIEHSLTCKERLFKKDKADSAFTDDGFALGLAYIIQLLDQESQLNSLHWFDSVQRKFNLDKQKVREQTVVSNSEDTKLKQTLTLTERRINTFQREFKLLEYSYSSARLFFQS
ncbi:WASH complex subunit 4 isoform X3 [Euwallacea fornicatus]|uniref:WASH complex subunit 4 isoform X3 n=1 Tax=Euwallacea fornicatus TaxID=995702 RepID=UPI00338E8373